MRHQYVRGEERESVYETPYGDLHMAVNTHELTADFHDGVGHVHLGYDISVEGEWQFYNQLDIDAVSYTHLKVLDKTNMCVSAGMKH